MAAAQPRSSMSFNGPFKGLNTRVAPTMLGPGYLWPSYSNNIIIKAGAVYPRPGFDRKDSGTLASGVTLYRTMYSVDFLNTSGSGSASYLLLQGDESATASNMFRLYQSGALNSATAIRASEATSPGTARATYLKLGEWVVICTGGDASMFRITGAGLQASREAGFATPTQVTTVNGVTSTVGGKLTGVFTWRYTAYDSTYGYESAPSQESDHTLLASHSIQLTNSITLPTGADRVRLYRRRTGAAFAAADGSGVRRGDGVGASDTWYLVGTYQNVADRTSTTQVSADASHIKLDAGASSVNDAYVDFYLIITVSGGAADNESRRITAYDGTTKVATVSKAFSATPASGDTYFVSHDNAADEELGGERAPIANFRPHDSESFPNRNPIYTAYHRNRAFYAAEDNVVWYSETPNQETDTTAFPSGVYVGDDSFFTIPTGQSEYITGLWSHGRALMVFTNQRVFAVDTDPLPDDFPVITELVGASGCVSYWTIAKSPAKADEPGVLYWLSRDGIQRFDGAMTRTVSKDALDYVMKTTTNRNDLVRASAVIDPDRMAYIVSCGSGGSTNPSTHFYYSIGDDATTTWTGGFDAYCWCQTYEDQNDQRPTLIFANNEAKLFRFDNEMNVATRKWTDNGTDITCQMQIAPMNAGLPGHPKHFGGIRLAFGPDFFGTPPTSVTMGPILGNSLTTVSTATAELVPNTSTVYAIHPGMHSDKIGFMAQWTVTTSGVGYAPIVGYEITAAQIGKQP